MNRSNSHLSNAWARIHPVPIVRGKGSFVFDDQGNRYLDFTSGIAVTSTGHCHPKVVEAIQRQAESLIFGQMNCVIPAVTMDYARELAEVCPEGIDSFFFSNSGSEAVEGAVKLAKVATGKTNLIAFSGGFHGRTSMAMALTTSKGVVRSGYQPLPSGVFIAPFPTAFHLGWTEEEATRFCLDRLQEMLKSQTRPQETAACILEPILGEGGYLPAPAAFLRGLRQICDQNGILLILDEIQTGFGRTGSMWAHQAMNVEPDILTIAKGMGSGLPISGIGCSGELMSKWQPGTHGGTYGGGSAIAMAAARATLQVIQEEGLVENASEQGRHLRQTLEEIVDPLDMKTDVRGAGLMLGVEFCTDQPGWVPRLQEECLRRGLILLNCGLDGNVVRFVPPLTVSADEIDQAMAILREAVQAIA